MKEPRLAATRAPVRGRDACASPKSTWSTLLNSVATEVTEGRERMFVVMLAESSNSRIGSPRVGNNGLSLDGDKVEAVELAPPDL